MERKHSTKQRLHTLHFPLHNSFHMISPLQQTKTEFLVMTSDYLLVVCNFTSILLYLPILLLSEEHFQPCEIIIILIITTTTTTTTIIIIIIMIIITLKIIMTAESHLLVLQNLLLRCLSRF